MNPHQPHHEHNHKHGSNCGHLAIHHQDHIDYLHDGHLHHTHENHYDECRLEVNAENPDSCTQGHSCQGHDLTHVHGPGCGHEAVPHGDHVDYLVDGHLHHQHSGHCDHHGDLRLVTV